MTLTMSFGRLIIESTLTTHVTCAAHHNQYDKLHIYSTHMHSLTVVLTMIMIRRQSDSKCVASSLPVSTHDKIIHRYDQHTQHNICHICTESQLTDSDANKRVCIDETHWHRRCQHQHDQHPSRHASQSSMPHTFRQRVTHVFNHNISNTSTNNSDTDKGPSCWIISNIHTHYVSMKIIMTSASSSINMW